MKNIFLGESFIDYVLEGVEIKDTMSSRTVSRYIMRAIIPGILITFGYIMIMKMDAEFFGKYEFIGTMLGGILFAFVLISIYYTKSELLTSNMMMTTVAKYYSKISIKKMLQILILCYIGNVLGGIIVGLLIAPTSVLNEGMIRYMEHAVELKQNYIANGHYFDLLVRAIFCNFYINLAMLMVYSGNIKDDIGKILIMIFAIFTFLILGFEHSVANSDLFVFAAIYQWVNGVDIGFNGVLATGNVIIALIGNYIGGGLLIGAYYAYVNDSRKYNDV